MHLRWWCQIFQASGRALETLPKATCPSSYVTWRSERCARKARGHVMWWEQARHRLRQEEELSPIFVPVASCDWMLVTEISAPPRGELVSAGAEHDPDWAGADFTHQLWVGMRPHRQEPKAGHPIHPSEFQEIGPTSGTLTQRCEPSRCQTDKVHHSKVPATINQSSLV